MALKSTIHKATLALSDLDRGVYGEHALTLALHPSETEERLMMRLLAFALTTPADDRRGALQACKGLSDVDEPDWWQPDLTGQLVQWVEVGHPDERRLARACAKAETVTVLAYAASTPIWWKALAPKVTRLTNLRVLQVPAEQSQALAAMCARAMRLSVTWQDGQGWVADDTRNVEVTPVMLWPVA